MCLGRTTQLKCHFTKAFTNLMTGVLGHDSELYVKLYWAGDILG